MSALTYRAALDATDVAAGLSRTVRDVLRAVVAVSMGPRAMRGRAVAYSVLAYMARCSRSTVARAVTHLEVLGLIRRDRSVEDARGGWGYAWLVVEDQLAALQAHETYAEHAARQRARRATARPISRPVSGDPCAKVTHTESCPELVNYTPPPPRADPGDAVDPFAVDPFAVDPLAAGPLDSQLEVLEDNFPTLARGWASRAVAGAADAARALVAGLQRGRPAAQPTSPPSAPSPQGEAPQKNNEPAIVERIVAAHGGRHRDEVEQLVATHGEARVAAAWTYAEQNASYQPPRPAYLRKWLTNPANTSPSSTPTRPSTSPPAPYSAAHATFPARELRRPETDEERAANLAALEAAFNEIDALVG